MKYKDIEVNFHVGGKALPRKTGKNKWKIIVQSIVAGRD